MSKVPDVVSPALPTPMMYVTTSPTWTGSGDAEIGLMTRSMQPVAHEAETVVVWSFELLVSLSSAIVLSGSAVAVTFTDVSGGAVAVTCVRTVTIVVAPEARSPVHSMFGNRNVHRKPFEAADVMWLRPVAGRTTRILTPVASAVP